MLRSRKAKREPLEEAGQGRSTIGAGEAVRSAPVAAHSGGLGQQPLTPLRGSGRGLWGKNSARALDELRYEWDRPGAQEEDFLVPRGEP